MNFVTLGLFKHQLNEDFVGAFIVKEIQVSDGCLDQKSLRSLSTREHTYGNLPSHRANNLLIQTYI